MTACPRQVGELGANALSPFQRLGEAISSGVTGELESLKSGAQGAVEGAQTQLGQSVTETIGNPLQARLCVLCVVRADAFLFYVSRVIAPARQTSVYNVKLFRFITRVNSARALQTCTTYLYHTVHGLCMVYLTRADRASRSLRPAFARSTRRG